MKFYAKFVILISAIYTCNNCQKLQVIFLPRNLRWRYYNLKENRHHDSPV